LILCAVYAVKNQDGKITINVRSVLNSIGKLNVRRRKMDYEIHPTEKAIEVLPKDGVIVFEADDLILLPDHLRLAVYAAEAQMKRVMPDRDYSVAKFTPVRYKKAPYDQVRG
jgi:hypothetical protein